jgi:hypothetical protein
MKRSEFVKIIYDIICDVDNGSSVGEIMAIANDALSACENAGMLPPNRFIVSKGIDVYEWEDEE